MSTRGAVFLIEMSNDSKHGRKIAKCTKHFFPICIGNINTADRYVISTLPHAILNLWYGYATRFR